MLNSICGFLFWWNLFNFKVKNWIFGWFGGFIGMCRAYLFMISFLLDDLFSVLLGFRNPSARSWFQISFVSLLLLANWGWFCLEKKLSPPQILILNLFDHLLFSTDFFCFTLVYFVDLREIYCISSNKSDKLKSSNVNWGRILIMKRNREIEG